MARRRPSRRQTPIRDALRPGSSLLGGVQDGLAALANADVLHPDVRRDFGDSLDLDAALQTTHPNDRRWDYLLGHSPSRELLAVETHSANTSEVSVLIGKKQAAMAQLRPHLRDGRTVARWFWVAFGNVDILDLDKQRRRLDQKGITFVGRMLLPKHMPTSEGTG